MSTFYQITSKYSTYNIVVQNNNIYLGFNCDKYICKKSLTNIEKHAFKNPYWIGWKNIIYMI